MSLLTFEIPQDKLQFLKERIAVFKEKAATLPEGDAKNFMTARYEILERFTSFLMNENEDIAIFELTNKGMDLRSAANVEIDLTLSKGGNLKALEDLNALNYIREELYKTEKTNEYKAVYYETTFPLVFEWWEKGEKSIDDEWKGVIKLPKASLK